MIVTVKVGFAIARPPSPANIRHSAVTLAIASESIAAAEAQARLQAAQFIASRPGVVMPTSTEVIGLVC